MDKLYSAAKKAIINSLKLKKGENLLLVILYINKTQPLISRCSSIHLLRYILLKQCRDSITQCCLKSRL